jgi:mitochondrial fission protein ELM1
VRGIPADRPLRIWALLGNGRGDDNQVLALAEALGLPFETKQIRYNQLRRIKPRLLGTSLSSLRPESRAIAAAEPPDLVISIGYRSVPLERVIGGRSGGRTRFVHLGNPRISPEHFDLVVPTPEYPVPDASNVMRTPITIQRPQDAATNAAAASAFLEDFPAPRRLLLVGGATLYWKLREEDVAAAITSLLRSSQGRGSLLVLGSPRTSEGVMHAARRELAKASIPAAIVPTEGPPSYRALLAAADMIFVTADSVSMISEAVATGKPVGLVPIRRSWYGRSVMALMDRFRPGRRVYPRDLRFFWRELEREGAGTIEHPRSGMARDPTAAVVQRVRLLLAAPARSVANDGNPHA